MNKEVFTSEDIQTRQEQNWSSAAYEKDYFYLDKISIDQIRSHKAQSADEMEKTEGRNLGRKEGYFHELEKSVRAGSAPPVILEKTPTGYIRIDGGHRIELALSLDKKEIEAFVLDTSIQQELGARYEMQTIKRELEQGDLKAPEISYDSPSWHR